MGDVIVAPAGRPVDYDAPNTGVTEYAKLTQAAMEPAMEAMKNRRDFQQKMQAEQMEEAFRAQQQKDLLAGQAATQSNRDKYLIEAQNLRDQANLRLQDEKMNGARILKAQSIFEDAGIAMPPKKADETSGQYVERLNEAIGGEKGVYGSLVKSKADYLYSVEKRKQELEDAFNSKGRAFDDEASKATEAAARAQITDATKYDFVVSQRPDLVDISPAAAAKFIETDPSLNQMFQDKMDGLHAILKNNYKQKNPKFAQLARNYRSAIEGLDAQVKSIAAKPWYGDAYRTSRERIANESSKDLLSPTPAKDASQAEVAPTEPASTGTGIPSGDASWNRGMGGAMVGTQPLGEQFNVTTPEAGDTGGGVFQNVGENLRTARENVAAIPASPGAYIPPDVKSAMDTSGVFGVAGKALSNAGEFYADKFKDVPSNMANLFRSVPENIRSSFDNLRSGPQVAGISAPNQPSSGVQFFPEEAVNKFNLMNEAARQRMLQEQDKQRMFFVGGPAMQPLMTREQAAQMAQQAYLSNMQGQPQSQRFVPVDFSGGTSDFGLGMPYPGPQYQQQFSVPRVAQAAQQPAPQYQYVPIGPASQPTFNNPVDYSGAGVTFDPLSVPEEMRY